MKQDADLDSLHLGSMIKEIAHQQNVSSKELAEILRRYEKNANKIYDRSDMDVEDVIRISHKLKYNFLKAISDQYLSHLPLIKNNSQQDSYQIGWDMQTGSFSMIRDIEANDTSQKINIGQYIRNVAEKKGLNEQNMAKLLHCSQSSVSDLYKCESLKVKKIIPISNILNHNFIEEVYLSRIFIVSSQNMFTSCAITVNPKQDYTKKRK